MVGMTKRAAERVASVARAHCDAGRFASIEWVAHREGREILRGAAGMADPLNGVALPDKPIYRIYSMTKPVISAIAMMLVEEGRLRLYDPVAAWISAFAKPEILSADGSRAPATRSMIVEHLMTHRAGLSYGFLPDCPVAALYRQTDMRKTAKPLEDMIATIASMPLAFEPGSQWRYSVATDVLARVIEIVEGKPIRQVVAERVTGPLGLKDTGFTASDPARLLPMFGNGNLDEIMNFAPGPQTLTPANVSNVYPHDDPAFGRGGYGLFSTLDDYAVIAEFLGSGRSGEGDALLSRKAVELMWTNRIPPRLLPLFIGPLPLPGYGFSLAGRVMLDTGSGFWLTSPGEIGWSGAASTFFLIDPVEKVTVVVMSQYLGAKIPLADDMRNAIYAALD